MPRLHYLTHPQVRIDPAVRVPDWSLSDEGRVRTERLAASERLRGTSRVMASAERKAVETAEILADSLGLAVEVRDSLGEIDRSATGFLPPAEHEATADRFFGNPDESVRGWERARDAQRRIVEAVEAVLDEGAAGDLLLVGHGAVGTLLLCHWAGLPLDRLHDQPSGGGHYFALELASRRVLHRWRRMEDWAW